MYCPDCHSESIVKNGFNALGKQIYQCNKCGRQFVLNPAKGPISDEKKELIDRLLLERISLAGIARAVGVSESWLQGYVNEKYAKTPHEVIVKKKSKGRLTMECDELWSFVGKKDNKQWVWLAIDRDTREIVGVYVGDRSEQSARALWNSLPPVYRQCAVSYTDFWDAYAAIFPSKRHRAVGKDSGQTNHIERFNCTLRQRISRLVRKALSFSKKLANHIGAIWYFIHHYNASLPINQNE
jgi:IS1 family transposase/transposase-like protein